MRTRFVYLTVTLAVLGFLVVLSDPVTEKDRPPVTATVVSGIYQFPDDFHGEARIYIVRLPDGREVTAAVPYGSPAVSPGDSVPVICRRGWLGFSARYRVAD